MVYIANELAVLVGSVMAVATVYDDDNYVVGIGDVDRTVTIHVTRQIVIGANVNAFLIEQSLINDFSVFVTQVATLHNHTQCVFYGIGNWINSRPF